MSGRDEKGILRTPRDRAGEIVTRLKQAGFIAYFAGGSVRDQLRGTAPDDYDIATSARPREILKLFPQAVPVGVSFGVVLVPFPPAKPGGKKVEIEVATFRSDGTYRDGRHPDSVCFTDEKEDARRRDFTINGMFYDPVEGRVIDYVGGENDLREGIIRTIGDPALRFGEDYLRMIRAVRFASRLGFQIEPQTTAALTKLASHIVKISAERVRDEFLKILTGPDPFRGLTLLENCGLLRYILPESSQMAPGGPLRANIDSFRYVKDASPELAFAILLNRTGGKDRVAEICRRFRLSNRQVEQVISRVADVERIREIRNRSVAELKRLIRLPHYRDLLEMVHAECQATGRSLADWEYGRMKEEAYGADELHPPELLSGGDLIAMGYSPGPRFREILTQIETGQLEGKIRTPGEARTFVIAHFPAETGSGRKLTI